MSAERAHQWKPRSWRRGLALLVCGAVTASVLAISRPASIAEASLEWPSTITAHPETVTADALPTVQINGVVWAQEIVGNTVYVGGSFTHARPAGAAPGQNQTPRANFLAYDLSTGQLRTDIVFNANAQVRTIEKSPDGSRIYVGGDFTTFGGQTRNRLAAIDTASNTLVAGFAPNVGFNVHDTAITATTVYVGGNFLNVGSTSRDRLAAFNLNGGLLPWAPSAPDLPVDSVEVSPDGTRVAIGGHFETFNGSTTFGRGFAVVNATTGATVPFAATSIIRNGGIDGSITSLYTDGELLYGAGYTSGRDGGVLEGTFAADWNGSIRWIEDCHGDSYSVFAAGDVVYDAGHPHYCGNIGGFGQPDPWEHYRAVAFTKQPAGVIARERLGYTNFQGHPRPDLLNWFPTLTGGTVTGLNQAAWHVTGNGRYVVMGGEFPRVNGVDQQGLVRFQTRQFASNTQGPMLFDTGYPIRVWSDAAGLVTVNWQGNRDRDDADLRYAVFRRTGGTGNGTLLHQRTMTAPFWNLPVMTFTDSTAVPGTTYQYRVQVTDGYNNFANSPWTSVTAASGGSRSAYVSSVLASEPDSYWRLDGASGSTVPDLVGSRAGTRPGGGLTFGIAGAVGNGTAARFSGASGVAIQTSQNEHPSHVLSLEAWFRAPGNSNGGLIVGFNGSNSDAGSTTNQDRHLYMDTAGRIHFGVNAVNPATVATGANMRDNRWHHAVGTLGPNGMQLFIDGVLVQQRTDVSNARTGYYGFWRIGGGALNGFPSTNTSSGRWFDGELDEVAIYKKVLEPAQIVGHYAAAGYNAPNIAPVAAFSATVNPATGVTAAFDGSASSDADGSVVRWAWNFGDGSAVVTETDPHVTHTYSGIGAFTVTLTVTDNEGASSQASTRVTTFDRAAPVWTDQTIGELKVSQAVVDGVAAVGLPAPTYSIVSGSLPPGLAFDPVTGAISGTPTAVGPYDVTIEAGNGVGIPITVRLTGGVASEVDPLVDVELATPGQRAAGSPIAIAGGGLLPGSTVTVDFDQIPLASGLVAADGAVDIHASLPSDVATGVHELVVVATVAAGAPIVTEQAIVVDWRGSLSEPPNDAGYQPVEPRRVLDTREPSLKLAAGEERRLALTPAMGVPDSAVSVVVNVTATEPEDAGFLTLYPCGSERPLASALNFLPGQSVPNLAIVPIGDFGEICIYSLAATHVVVDLNGYFAPEASARIDASTPVRLIDTRNSVKLGAGETIEVQVTGDGFAAPGATAAVLNVTVTEPEAFGFITLFPCSDAVPTSSNANYAPGQTVANQAYVTLSAEGTVCAYSLSPTHLILDLNAWMQPGGSPELVSFVPVRVLDTRDTAKVVAGQTIELDLAGPGGIAGAEVFAVNTTITEPEGPGFLTFFPCGEPQPLASNINFDTGQVVANHTTAAVGADGKTCIYASTTTHVVVDVEGVYISLP